jgi:hypothetical protein
VTKPSITIGISVYDRINEAKVSALLAKTVLANDFEVRVVIATCKPEAQNNFAGSDYIDFIFEPDFLKEVPSKYNIHSNLGAARAFSSFLKCGAYAKKYGTDFFCFGNAGSWLLSSNGIVELTSRLIVEKKLIACRVAREGRKYSVEDHFFLVNLKLVENPHIFNAEFLKRDFNPIFFYENSIHALLENWINFKTEPGQVIIYSDLTDCKNHFGESVKCFVPFSIDPKRGFMHSNPFDWADEMLTLRIKYIETCDLLDNQKKETVINLLKDETIGKPTKCNVALGNLYYLDSKKNKRLFYVVVKSKLVWIMLRELSLILQYLGNKFPTVGFIAKKMQRLLNRHSAAYEKINFEKIQ